MTVTNSQSGTNVHEVADGKKVPVGERKGGKEKVSEEEKVSGTFSFILYAHKPWALDETRNL